MPKIEFSIQSAKKKRQLADAFTAIRDTGNPDTSYIYKILDNFLHQPEGKSFMECPIFGWDKDNL